MGRRHKWIFAAAILALIFVRPQQAVNGVQRAMRMWYQGVAPALLPFLALMPMLTGREACAAYEKIFSPVMKKCFRLPGSAAPAVIAAMLAGSPGGAAAVNEIRSGGSISDRHAARIALSVCGVSPAWLVLGVGCSLLGSKAVGVKLALIQAAVQLILLKTLEKVEIQTAPLNLPATQVEKKNPVWSAVETTLGVCGYMCVFGACGSVIASFAGEKAGIALLSVLDLPSGAALIAEGRFPGHMIVLGAALGFGGICIAAQNMERLRMFGVKWRDYIIVRCFAAVLSALGCAFVFRNPLQITDIEASGGKMYVISLFTAAVCVLPGMIFLSKNIFLNKGKAARKRGKI